MTVVRINAFDQDHQIVAGTPTVATAVLSTRIIGGSWATASGTADLDQVKFERYFPRSGTYAVTLIVDKSTNHPLLDMGINLIGQTRNTTNLFSQLDLYNGSLQEDQKFVTAVKVARGTNEINIKANGKNASSSAYVIRFSMIEFNLIAEHEVFPESSTPKTEGILLARYKCEIAESSKVFSLADLVADKYAEVMVKISGKATASLQLQMTFNGLGANYIQKGHMDLTSVTAINITTGSVLAIGSTTLITGADEFEADVTIKKDAGGVWTGGKCHCTDYSTGQAESGWSNDGATSTKLSQITISTSTSTWAVGTTIGIYGVKRL